MTDPTMSTAPIPPAQPAPPPASAPAPILPRASRFKRIADEYDVAALAMGGLFGLALLYSIYFARDLLLPVFLALLLNLLLRPVVKGLYRLGLPEPAGAAVVVLMLLAVVAVTIYQLSGPAAEWLERGPVVLRQLEFKLGDLQAMLEEARRASHQIERITQDNAGPAQVVVRGPSLAEQVLTQTQSILANLVIMQVLLYFFLARGRQTMEQIISVIPDIDQRVHFATVSADVQRNITAYLATITVINTALGLATALAMWLLGMPNPALWGVMAGLFNFIPYVGSAVTAAVLMVVALLSFERALDVLLPPLVFLTLTALEGNFITPTVVGRRLTLNPIAVFLALMFWGWIWGIPGALLAVPILAAVKIVCDATPPLKPVGALLGN